MLPAPVVAEVLQGTKTLAGVCFVAVHDPDVSPEEVELLRRTLEALHEQGTAFSRRLVSQTQLAPRAMPAAR